METVNPERMIATARPRWSSRTRLDRNHHGDAEECTAMRHGGRDTQQEHRGEIGRQRAGHLARV
ncbi:hypothetical protein ACVOMV_23575 [Mesorhizobium atlanticum]